MFKKYIGCYPEKRRNTFKYMITLNGNRYYKGGFKSIEDAAYARNEKLDLLGKEAEHVFRNILK